MIASEFWTRQAQAILARTRQQYPWAIGLKNEAQPEGDEGGEEGGEGAAAKDAKSKTYTKAEVDGMVKKATAAARREYADYEEKKLKAEEYDKLQESSKSNEEKLRIAHDRAVRERDAALTRAQSTTIRAAIVSVASRLGAVDPDAVAALLPRDDLVIEGDEVVGVEEAVKLLLVKKPYLRKAGSNVGGTEIGTQQTEVITRSQIREWARSGQLTAERQKQIDEANKANRILNK